MGGSRPVGRAGAGLRPRRPLGSRSASWPPAHSTSLATGALDLLAPSCFIDVPRRFYVAGLIVSVAIDLIHTFVPTCASDWPGQAIQVIRDDFSTHKAHVVRFWRAARSVSSCTSPPVYPLWINQVEW